MKNLKKIKLLPSEKKIRNRFWACSPMVWSGLISWGFFPGTNR